VADARTVLVVASGTDRVAARDLVLKIEEAAWLPSAMRDLETFLHGHLPATGPETGLVLLLTEPLARTERLRRACQALAAARELGIRSAAILAAGVAGAIPEALSPAGRIVVPEAAGLPGPAGSLLGTAGAIQLLTLEIARARGTNPDPIRRDDPRYLRAARSRTSRSTDPIPPVGPDRAGGRLRRQSNSASASWSNHLEVAGQEHLEHDPLRSGIGVAATAALASSGVPGSSGRAGARARPRRRRPRRTREQVRLPRRTSSRSRPISVPTTRTG